jgi:hypothetical protein
MDELNLAAMFAKDDENDRRPNHRKHRFRPGVGMEKPTEVEDIPPEEPIEEPEDDVEDEMGPGVDELPEEGEDEAFDDLVSRMAGASASEKRAAERRRKSRKPGNDSLRAEFADRR